MTILKIWPRQGILGFLALLIFASVPAPAQACSGGAEMPMSGLADYDLIVHATVLEADERGYSAIMLVDRYIKGRSPQFLPVMRWRPALEVTSAVRGYTTECLYNGGGAEWTAGQQGFFALKYNDDGTYTDGTTAYYGAPFHSNDEGGIRYYEWDAPTNTSVEYNVSDEQFEQILLQKFSTYDEAISPNKEVRYPLKRWLTITTESGSQYHLNPDRSITPIDTSTAPIAISHDGSHVVFRQGNDLIVQYYELVLHPDGDYFSTRFSHALTGNDLLFSPNSSLIAIWNDQLLRVYMFDNFEYVGYGQALGMQLIGEHELNLTENTMPRVAWSQNSAVLAFADDTGIWRWPLFADAEPERIVPDESVSLLELSATGRYVRYGDREEWLLLDIQTGETSLNALITPNEQNVISVGAENWRYSLRDDEIICIAPLSETCPVTIVDIPPQWFWYKKNQIAMFSCFAEYSRCRIELVSWDISVEMSDNITIPLINVFEYDYIYDRPAIAVQDYIIGLSFDFASNDVNGWEFEGDYVDLTGIIDSPIVAVEWGQPLFYDSAYYEATE